MVLKDEEKQYILKIARMTLEAHTQNKEMFEFDIAKFPVLEEKRACFISLYIKGKLRGCIGHILPVQELYKDVIENTVSAASRDPRFNPVTEDEVKDITIEVSVLSVPKELGYEGEQDLLDKLKPKEHGVIIEKGMHNATFLPQVWEHFDKKEDFLSQLCLKAGLPPEAWKKDISVKTYTAEVFKE